MLRNPWYFTKVIARKGQVLDLEDVETKRRFSRHRSRVKTWGGTYEEWMAQQQTSVKEPQGPKMMTVTATIPPGSEPGQWLVVTVHGKKFKCIIPDGGEPGQNLTIQVPTAAVAGADLTTGPSNAGDAHSADD